MESRCYSTARALFCVFVEPALLRTPRAAQRCRPLRTLNKPRLVNTLHNGPGANHPLFRLPQRHTDAPHLSPNKPTEPAATPKPRKPTGPLTNEQIPGPRIYLVQDGKISDHPLDLRAVLSSFNHVDYKLVQVDTRDDPSPSRSFSAQAEIPVCRIFSGKELYEQKKTKRRKPKKSLEETAKKMEVNWALGANDLGHKLKKVKGWLEEGKRVEVVFAKKKGRGRQQAEEREASEKVKIVREAVEDVGGKEISVEGRVGGIMKMVFDPKQE